MRRIVTVVLFATAVAACGGGQTTEDTTPPPPPVTEEPVEQVQEEVDNRIFYVFWDGIHCLTVYPEPGPIRSEEPPNANATFSGEDNPHFSIISVYYEKEDWFAPHVDAATSLDDLLERVGNLELVEVQEDVNPVYEGGW